MRIVHVHVHVKEEFIAAFIEATQENARNSVQESGIARFDVIQQEDDPTRFILIEVYKTEDAPAKHKETTHYNTWRETVNDMMAEPRQGIWFTPLFPDKNGWD